MESNFKCALAHTTELDPFKAVMELIEKCKLQLNGKPPKAGILYAGIDADFQFVLDSILEEWPCLQLIGCSTDGEFSSEGGYCEDSLILTLFASEKIDIVAGCINNKAEDIFLECMNAFTEANNRLQDEAKLCILLSDVLKINADTILSKLSAAADGNLLIVGGISADSWRFCESKQLYNSTVSSDISSFLLFSGSLDLSLGIDSGWESIGEAGTITKSEGNVVYEINNKPTLEFYKSILGEKTMPTLELPISIYDEQGKFRFLRTTFENYDIKTGSVTYLGNVPVNHKVRITVVNRESILKGAEKAIITALEQFPETATPNLILCFSCSARRVLLGTRTNEENQIIMGKISNDVKVSGFYTYGEICPNILKLENEFHNETFVALILG